MTQAPSTLDKLRHLGGRIASSLDEQSIHLRSRLQPVGNGKTVSINMFPTSGAWGGSSEFVKQFVLVLRRYGFRVVFDLNGSVDVIVVIDPRDDLQKKAYGMQEIVAYKRAHPATRVLHRINECSKRKADTVMDEFLRKANDVADHTVFISEWLRDYFIERWFDSTKAHSVIYNGADPAIFHPIGSAVHTGQGLFRLVTHHWSPNPMKGFPVYAEVDRLIAEGELPGIELWIIGQWPKDIAWRSAKLLPPASGHELADLLRQCHGYITASLWEPCGMHHIEGAQCGLPLLYHENGGGIVEAGRRYGLGFTEPTLVERLQEFRRNYPELRQRTLADMPSGDRMASDYARVVQRMLVGDGV